MPESRPSPESESESRVPSPERHMISVISVISVVLTVCSSVISSAAPTRIVAMGDSTTAGTPGFKSPIEAPPRRPRRRNESVRLLADEGAPGVGGPQPRRERRAQRPDPRAVRARRRGGGPEGGGDHRGGQRRLPGASGRARRRAAPRDVRACRAGRHPRRGGIDHPLQHGDPGAERAHAADQRVDAGAAGDCLRRYPRGGGGRRTTPTGCSILRTACTRAPPATAAWPTRSVRRWNGRCARVASSASRFRA